MNSYHSNDQAQFIFVFWFLNSETQSQFDCNDCLNQGSNANSIQIRIISCNKQKRCWVPLSFITLLRQSS